MCCYVLFTNLLTSRFELYVFEQIFVLPNEVGDGALAHVSAAAVLVFESGFVKNASLEILVHEATLAGCFKIRVIATLDGATVVSLANLQRGSSG